MPQEYQGPRNEDNTGQELSDERNRSPYYASETPLFDELRGEFNYSYNERLKVETPIFYQMGVEYVQRVEELKKNREIIIAKGRSIEEARKLALDSVLFVREQSGNGRLASVMKSFADRLGLHFFRFSTEGKLKELTEEDLVRQESRVGTTLFGPGDGTHTATFFYAKGEWIYHRATVDGSHQRITRYIPEADSIRKIERVIKDGEQLPIHYAPMSNDEANNLSLMVDIYHERVGRDVYSSSDLSSFTNPTNPTDRQITSN